MYYNELYHHGRLGQKWGTRNGPPYPLSSYTVGRAYSKRKLKKMQKMEEKRKKTELQDEEKEKDEAEKRREEARRAAAKEKEERLLYEERKEMSLRKGKATDVLFYKYDLDNKTLDDALKRVKWTKELEELSKKEKYMDSGWAKIDSVMDKLSTITNWVTTGTNLYNSIERLLKALDRET